MNKETLFEDEAINALFDLREKMMEQLKLVEKKLDDMIMKEMS